MRTRLILNPLAGRRHRLRDERDLVRRLATVGIDCEQVVTQGPGDATTLAREAAAQGYDLVIAAGGDGTVHEVVNGLAETETAMAVLPLGTENILAREIHVPRHDLDAACRALATGRTVRVDVGRTPQRYFLLMAGLGFDAQVVREVHPDFKRVGKSFAFFATGFSTLVHYDPPALCLEVDGRTWNLRPWGLLVSNATLYGWRVQIAPRASMTDGKLDVVAFLAEGRLSFLGDALRTTLRGEMWGSGIRHWTAQEVRVLPSRPLPMQLDGETIDEPELTFRLLPAALRLAVPRGTELRGTKGNERKEGKSEEIRGQQGLSFLGFPLSLLAPLSPLSSS